MKIIISGLENEKSKAIFENLMAQVDKWANLLVFAMVNVTLPCVTIPKIVISFFAYYATDAGSDAFELPFTAW